MITKLLQGSSGSPSTSSLAMSFRGSPSSAQGYEASGIFLAGGICTTIAVGWTIEKGVHLAVTIVLTFVWGVTYTGLFTVGGPCSSQHLHCHKLGPSLRGSLEVLLTMPSYILQLMRLTFTLPCVQTFLIYKLILNI